MPHLLGVPVFLVVRVLERGLGGVGRVLAVLGDDFGDSLVVQQLLFHFFDFHSLLLDLVVNL